MNISDNKLEEYLARLESGESLEACLAGLPEEEAALLKKAVTLNAIAESAPMPKGLADQRRKLLQAAKEKNMTPSKSVSLFNKPRSRWFFPVALTGSAFVIFTCMVIFSLMAGMLGLRWFNQSRDVVALEAPNPQSARIQELRGLVDVLNDSGAWETAEAGQVLEAGQSIRTGKLSSVALGFFDGSRTRLGPEAEMSITELDAQNTGPRVIVLMQNLGESQHDVAKSSDPASRYEVYTPSGMGAAKGTSFRVFVTVALFVRFVVDEGAVAVTNLDSTVIVVAGQTTIIVAGHTPTHPIFRIEGEGVVEQTGSVWHIAGRTFRTGSNTSIVGNPQVGDVVAFQARMVRDGSPILDRVVLLEDDATESRFSFSGTVDSVTDTEWTIAGKAVQVDDKAGIDAGIAVGDIVEVKGRITDDDELLATDIRLIETNEDDLPFNFVGVINTMGADEWIISGTTIVVTENTNIEAGLVAGDVVQVRGRIRDGDWLAKSIVLADDDDRKFAITGTVDNFDPWTVDGIEFETDDRTRIDDDIEVGDRVKVEGRILEDGTWMAGSIELLEDQEPRKFNFTGLVGSMNPWEVGGVSFTTDESTSIDSLIVMGDEVRVKGVIQPDGVWLAKSIERLEDDEEDLGCLDFSTVVREAGVNQIVLQDWQVVQLNNNIEVEGQINVATVIVVSGCTQGNGSFTITHIIVIYQLDLLPVINKPPSQNDNDSDDDD